MEKLNLEDIALESRLGKGTHPKKKKGERKKERRRSISQGSHPPSMADRS